MNERELFIAALQKESAAERAAFLAEACGADSGLRQQVEGLLGEHEQLGSFLESPSAVSVPDTIDQAITERPGTVIGPYKLLEQIGEGGFGVVFMAEQQAPIRRKVALKVLKPGMETRPIVARFEAERQALALMDHPNIATVLDGGQTPTGRPYFVMELVKGVPITDYCDQSELTPRERLELLLTVCEAVQHAHQKGVIHRDIKPSNLLVTMHDATPVVKAIDFGIAKALGQQLTDKTLFTGFGQMIGTPLYMSPEQAGWSGLDVDTRSDIYSLGVLLYELLTGTTPFDKERLKEVGYDEMRRIIREEEPPKPSTRISTMGQAATTVSMRRKSDPKRLSQLFRGELDWIVMKCLEKDRNRRYETANSLAQDIERYLHDEPVQACPPSAAYRFRKFAHRNKRALGTAALLGVVSLVAVGAVAGTLGWVARDRAERQAKLNGEVEAAIQEGFRRADRALTLTGSPSQWEAELAMAFSSHKRAEGLAAGQELLLDAALNERLQALADRLRTDEEDRRMVQTIEQIQLAAVEPNITESRFSNQESVPKYREAFKRYGIAAEATPPKEAAGLMASKAPAIQTALVAALTDWFRKSLAVSDFTTPENRWLARVIVAADTDIWPNRVRDARLKKDRKALEVLAEQGDVVRQPSTTIILLADVLDERGDSQNAIRLLRRAQEYSPGDFWINHRLAEKLSTSKPPQWEDAITFYRVTLALRPGNPGVLVNLGNALRSKGDLPGAIATFRKATDLAPKYAAAHNMVGIALMEQGDLPGALKAVRKAIELEPQSSKWTNNLGTVLHHRGDLPGAIAAHRKAVELDRKNTWAYNNLGLALKENNDLRGALAAYRQAIRIDPDYAYAYMNLGVALKAQNDLAGALAASRKAIEMDPYCAKAHYNLGGDLSDSGDLVGAIKSYRTSIELDPKYADAHYNLGIALTKKGDLAGAVIAYRKAIEIKPDYLQAHLHLGDVFQQSGDQAGAIAAYQKVIAVARKAIDAGQKSAAAHLDLGLALYHLGDLPRAIAALNKSIELDSKDAGAHSYLGMALLARGDFPGAIVAHHRAIACDPKSAGPQVNLGYTLLAQGDLPGAIAAFRKATELDPQSVEAHSNLGLALSRKDKLDEAEAAYKKALAINPNFAVAHNNLGLIHKAKWNMPAAMAAYRKALDLKPDYVDALLNLGSGLSQQEDCAKAMPYFKKAQQLQPDNAYPWYYQALSYLGAGDRKAYKRICADMLDQFAATKDPRAANLVLYACTAAPEAAADPAVLSTLAQIAAPRPLGFARTAGAGLYRAGKYEASISYFDKAAMSMPLRAWDYYFLAMAHHRLDHAEHARQYLDKAADWTKEVKQKEAEGNHLVAWFERITVEHLHREAEALLKKDCGARNQ
jgi:tetratricopeptide (TPR) repeat protein/serine/threonine protein kinase